MNIGVNTEMIIDSGVSCNVFGKVEWERLKQQRVKCQSLKSDKQLYPYGSDKPTKIMGSFDTLIVTANQSLQAEFIVVYRKGQSLLGRDTALQLGVLKLTSAAQINAINMTKVNYSRNIAIFQNLGKLFCWKFQLIKRTSPSSSRCAGRRLIYANA